MALKLKVTLVRSALHRGRLQAATVRGLGLRRLHQRRVIEDTPAVRRCWPLTTPGALGIFDPAACILDGVPENQ